MFNQSLKSHSFDQVLSRYVKKDLPYTLIAPTLKRDQKREHKSIHVWFKWPEAFTEVKASEKISALMQKEVI